MAGGEAARPGWRTVADPGGAVVRADGRPGPTGLQDTADGPPAAPGAQGVPDRRPAAPPTAGGQPGVPHPRTGPDRSLVRIHDPAGRLRGLGFAADHDGTVITGHEVVDGPACLVLRADAEQVCTVGPDAVTALPEAGLALIRTRGLALAPLPVTAHDSVTAGTYVRIPAGGWREARVLGTCTVTYTAAGRRHPVGSAVELAVGTAGSDALRPGGGAAGGPVLDAASGAVLAVLGTALEAGRHAAGFAVPLRRAAARGGELARLLDRNAATVPAPGCRTAPEPWTAPSPWTAPNRGTSPSPRTAPNPTDGPGFPAVGDAADTRPGPAPAGIPSPAADPEALRRLADRVAPGDLGVRFWLELPLPEEERFDLLRRLVVRDPAPGRGERVLDAVAGLLATAPGTTQRHLTRWFADDRPLAATPHATVAAAAQALLHTHRHHAPDDLAEALVACAHPRAVELLTALAEEEPSVLCRAVDRWAHDDERPDRHLAAATYALHTSDHAGTPTDDAHLRAAAVALLTRHTRAVDGTHPASAAVRPGPGDCAPCGAGTRRPPGGADARPPWVGACTPSDAAAVRAAALTLLLRDPATRAHHLPDALRSFMGGEPRVSAGAVLVALDTHPEAVVEALRTRLLRESCRGVDTVLRALAGATRAAVACRVAGLVRDVAVARPEVAPYAGEYVELRLEAGAGARADVLPLVDGLLGGGSPEVRCALAHVLTAPGSAASRPLRDELLDLLLERERHPDVLDTVLTAAADAASGRGEARTRVLVHRVGLLLARTPEGALHFDRRLVERSRAVPGFAALVADWLAEAPEEWAALVGPSARRTIEQLPGARRGAGSRVPA
ncbi:hypothetical protein ACWCP6_32930 [Streptomyces sp. NPDC002004]